MYKNQLHLLLSQRPKNDFIKEGIKYYKDKLFPFAAVEVHESRQGFGKNFDQLKKKTLTVVLDNRGRQFTSESFSQMWGTLTEQRAKDICFMIGGPYGFKNSPRADISFSLSSLTYNYELVPLVLLEQVYRAYMILNRIPYHHG